MSKLISIEQFDGGIQSDKRARTVGGCAMSRHFDHTIAPNKLVPRRDFESHNSLNGVTDGIEARTITCLGFSDGGAMIDSLAAFHNDCIIAIGKKASGTGCAAFFTEIDGGTAGWLSGYDGLGSLLETSDVDPSYGPLCEVPDTSPKMFFPSNSGDDVGLLSFAGYITLDGDIALTDNENNEWDEERGPDNNYYITRYVSSRSTGANTNCIDQLNADGTVTEDVFCVQPSTSIQNLCRNGNYMGLACCDASKGRRAELQVWDTVNDDPISVVPWGQGNFYWLEELNGDYIGVTAEGLYFDDYLTNDKYELVVRVSNGGTPRLVTKLQGAATLPASGVWPVRQPRTWKRADEFLFYTRVPMDAGATTIEEGLWSVRKSSTGEYALTLAYDTSSLGEVLQWIGVGEHAYFVHDTTSSVSRINLTASYTVTSSFETLYNPQMDTQDYFMEKALEAVRVKTEPLPAAGQVIIKCRKDEETSWTTIATITTDNLITYEAVNIEASGAVLPDFKEIQFRLESTGGAVITGFEYRYTTISDLLHG